MQLTVLTQIYVVNTDITWMFMDSMRMQTYQCAQYTSANKLLQNMTGETLR